MAKSMDIVDFNPSDGFTPLQVQKLNWNFRKLAVTSSQVDVDQTDAIKGLVIKTTDLAADQKMTVGKSGTRNKTVLNFGIPAAQVRITNAQVDSVLAGDAPSGDSILNLTGLSRFWAGVKQYVDDAIGAIGAFVRKTGDTMTGDLVFKSGTDDYTVTPDSIINYPMIQFKDKNDKKTGSIYLQHSTNGYYYFRVQAEKYNSSGTSLGTKTYMNLVYDPTDEDVNMTVSAENRSTVMVQGKNDFQQLVFRAINPGNWTSSDTLCDAYIRSYNDGNNGYGRNLVMYSGGNTIIGSGESPASAYSGLGATNMPAATDEELLLTADGSIHFYPGANTWGNRGTVKIDTAGNLFILGRRDMATPDRASLIIQNPLMQATKEAQNGLTTQYYNEVFFRDKNGQWLGTVSQNNVYDANNGANAGASRIFLQSRMMKTDGTWATNWFGVYSRKDGSQHYGFGSPANFRSDLGCNNASNLTTGTVALARGGTASDNTSRAINTVFAGPSSGSAGNASWRKLVAADIPNLNASKITEGSLAAARGGTGRTAARLSTSAIVTGKNIAKNTNIGTYTTVFNYSFFLVVLSGSCYLFGYRTGGANAAGTIYAIGGKDPGSGASWIAAEISVSAAGLLKYTAGGDHKISGGSWSSYDRNFVALYGLY